MKSKKPTGSLDYSQEAESKECWVWKLSCEEAASIERLLSTLPEINAAAEKAAKDLSIKVRIRS